MLPNHDIKVIRSKRKTCSIEVKNDLTILVRVPLKMTNEEIIRFINNHSTWINKQLSKISVKHSIPIQYISKSEHKKLIALAKEDLPPRINHYANLIGVTFNRVTIRTQKSRWGSCSSKGNLNFNCLLMLCPEKIRDYIVVHELCHILEMNHSNAFWAKVSAIMPEYKECKKWLKTHESEIMARAASLWD